MFSSSKADLQVELAPYQRKRPAEKAPPLVLHQRAGKRPKLSSRETEDPGEKRLAARLRTLTEPARPELGNAPLIPVSMGEQLLSIFRSIPLNLFASIPIPKTKESHLRQSALNKHRDTEGALEMFRTQKLWTIFQRVIVHQNPTKDEWMENLQSLMRRRKDIMDGNWPKEDSRWKNVACVQGWDTIMQDPWLNNLQVTALEGALMKSIKDFCWFPVIGGDHPWMQQGRESDKTRVFPKELWKEIRKGLRPMQNSFFVIVMLNPEYSISDGDWIREYQ
jgi:hypothetical protein